MTERSVHLGSGGGGGGGGGRKSWECLVRVCPPVLPNPLSDQEPAPVQTK